MSERRLYESIKYSFATDEILAFGEALAREAQIVIDLREQKSSTMAELTAQVKAANRRVAEIAEKINNGYEMREVECMAIMETPRPGMKRIIRLDTNESVRDEPMTLQEMQGSFGFKEADSPEE